MLGEYLLKLKLIQLIMRWRNMIINVEQRVTFRKRCCNNVLFIALFNIFLH